jgi:hypothetical protein
MLLDLWIGAHRPHIDPTFATLECKRSDEDDMLTEKADVLQKEVDQCKRKKKGAHDPKSTSRERYAPNFRRFIQTFLPGSLVSAMLPSSRIRSGHLFYNQLEYALV